MKKILFSLLMLCNMTAALAEGTGDGSKEHPYTGEWLASELGPKLEAGKCLAYNCVIQNGTINVYDSKLGNLKVVPNWKDWAVGDAIDDSPFSDYERYCFWNTPNERKDQVFVVTKVECKSNKDITITGYYSGVYNTLDASGFIHVDLAEGLKKAIQKDNSAKIWLEDDIDISNIGTICDTFKGCIYGKYQYTNKEGEVCDTVYSLKGGREKGKAIPHLFNKLDHAVIAYIMLDSISVKGTEDNTGSLASTASHTTFNNLYMRLVSVSSEDDNVGGLVGKADNCTFEKVTFCGTTVKSDEIGAGGLVGESSHCIFKDCKNNMRCTVFADGATLSNYAKAGGYTGYSQNDTFTNCINASIVAGCEDSVGGFAGRSDGTEFYGCINSGVIFHASEGDFNKVVEDLNKKLDDLITNPELVQTVEVLVDFTVGFTAGAIAGYLLSNAVEISIAALEAIACWGVGAAVFFAIVGVALYAEWLSTLHDEIGGICGYALGGKISLCTNEGFINCKDSQGGGIVGRAVGVMIDNCLNTKVSKWGDDDCGGLIGSAASGCKVTNCLSTSKDALIGEATDMNPASGNNYNLGGDSEWCMSVDSAKLKSGIVAYWLNQSAENRNLAEKPWRQKLISDPTNPNDTIGDFAPCLEAAHPLVTVSDLKPTKISTPKELIDFADRVNGGDQFAVAELVNNIDMTGINWTPIGKNEANKHFRGIFDGRGHTIKGLKYDGVDKSAGLFGAVHIHAEIRNVIVGEGSEITSGDAGAAGIVGSVNTKWHWGNVIIENCGSYADVKANNNGGAILGRVQGDEGEGVKVFVNNCFNLGTITADNGNSGLICGYMKNLGVVRNCWSGGQLRTGQGHSTLPYSVVNPKNEGEFFVGYDNKLDIQNCYIVNPQTNIDRYFEYPLQSGVTTISKEFVAIGELTRMLNGNSNDTSKPLIWQQNLGTDTYPNLAGTKGVYHTREVKNEYGTVCLPFELKSNDEISYYRFLESKNENDELVLAFTYSTCLDAGEPALFRTMRLGELTFQDAGGSWRDMPSNTASSYSVWFIAGTFDQKVFTESTTPSSNRIYYVSGGVIKNAKKATIDPFRAYFSGPSIETLTGNGSSQAKSVRIVLEEEDGSTTALESIANDLVPVHINSKAYSLMGTEVNSSYRGIVIRNGKKMIQNR